MKLLVDMNLSPRWVELLTHAKLEAVHWSSVGRPESLDEEIMAYAAKHDYVVITNDLDFGAILAVTHREKPSVVQIRSDNLNPDVIGSQIIAALQQLEEQLQEGALIIVEPLRTRVRLLPLITAKTS
jgi:predicted nuclease of predicted toxin-antitoxin system